MSIATAIQNARTKVAAAYTSCNNKGATMPSAANQNLSNLASTIDSIVTDISGNLYIQKVVRNEVDGVVTHSREEEYVGPVTELAVRKYQNDTTLVEAMIPDTIKRLRGYAFQNCTNLKHVCLECATRIDEHIFDGCTALEYVHLPEGATTIEQYAFSSCTSLKYVSLPSTLTTIGEYVFNGCTALKVDFVLPPSVLTVPRAVFYQSGITSAKLYVSAITGNRLFTECPNLVSVDLSESTITTTYNVSASVTSSGTFANCPVLKTVSLPSTCTEIGTATFFYDRNLETVTGTENVTVIRYNAFRECNSLSSLDMSSVETIETYTFTNTKLTTVNLPSIITLTGSTYGPPFNGCKSLISVDLGASCTTIGDRMFQGCSSLTTLVIRATTPPSFGSNIFQNANASAKIYVPYSADHSILTAYQNATNLTQYAARILELNSDGTIPV